MKLIFVLLFALFVISAQAQVSPPDSVPGFIDEKRFIHINGIEQWVTIKGNATKPVVLFLHGGPGSPLSPYADAIYGQWTNDFILVQWDQRGTGRTYGHIAPDELTPEYLRSNPLSLAQMTDDGIELARYLLKHLKKKKLILFGSSWGSVVGVKMAQKSPELFYAYIGHSQLVHPAASEQSAYHELVNRANKSKDQVSLNILQLMGSPPYDTARNVGRFMKLVKKYQQKNAIAAPASWFIRSPEYDNEKDNRFHMDGDDYSFVNYAGDKRLGVTSISSTINFFKDGLVFKIPVYFIQGEEDMQTPATINKDYFNKIIAPDKKFILLPKTEHGFNQSVINTHFDLMKKYIVPL